MQLSKFWVAEEVSTGRICTWFQATPKMAGKRLRATERALMELNGIAPNLTVRRVSRREYNDIQEKYKDRSFLVELSLEEVLH